MDEQIEDSMMLQQGSGEPGLGQVKGSESELGQVKGSESEIGQVEGTEPVVQIIMQGDSEDTLSGQLIQLNTDEGQIQYIQVCYYMY